MMLLPARVLGHPTLSGALERHFALTSTSSAVSPLVRGCWFQVCERAGSSAAGHGRDWDETDAERQLARIVSVSRGRLEMPAPYP